MISISTLMFYISSSVLLSAAMMVVTARNTVHGVLFLILAFFNAAILFILAHAEFLAMMLIVVYVGAVAVLFLFVVMMLSVEVRHHQEPAKRYFLIGGLVGVILTIELILMGLSWKASPEAFDLTAAPSSFYGGMPNIQVLGSLLYTHYVLVFQAAGIILLIAMVGAIILTLRQREGLKKQKIRDQIARRPKESVRLVDISNGSGI